MKFLKNTLNCVKRYANRELVAKMREILRDSIYENLNNDETVLLYDEDNCVDF